MQRFLEVQLELYRLKLIIKYCFFALKIIDNDSRASIYKRRSGRNNSVYGNNMFLRSKN
jgi:hypothetical protein